MGQVIIKTSKELDLYAVWSSVIDAPIETGDRTSMANYLRDEWKLDPDGAEAVLKRTDKNGSSDRTIKFGHWDDETLPIGEGAPTDGEYHIRRNRLPEYVQALIRGDDDEALSLLTRGEST